MPSALRGAHEDRLLTINETADYLRLSRAKTYTMAATGELPAVRFGRSVRVPVAALDEWIKEQTQNPAA